MPAKRTCKLDPSECSRHSDYEGGTTDIPDSSSCENMESAYEAGNASVQRRRFSTDDAVGTTATHSTDSSTMVVASSAPNSPMERKRVQSEPTEGAKPLSEFDKKQIKAAQN